MNVKGSPIAEMLIPKSTSERSDLDTNTNPEKLSEKLSAHSIPEVADEKQNELNDLPVDILPKKFSDGRS